MPNINNCCLNKLRSRCYRCARSARETLNQTLNRLNPLIHNVPKMVRDNLKVLQHLLQDF